jgi:hypothetical protein
MTTQPKAAHEQRAEGRRLSAFLSPGGTTCRYTGNRLVARLLRKISSSLVGALVGSLLALVLSAAAQAAPFAYIPNITSNNVSVIDTASTPWSPRCRWDSSPWAWQ